MKLKVESIEPNPICVRFDIPLDEAKVKALICRALCIQSAGEILVRRSFADDGAFEVAYREHAVEASRRLGRNEVEVIIRDLVDERGRFLAMANTETIRCNPLL